MLFWMINLLFNCLFFFFFFNSIIVRKVRKLLYLPKKKKIDHFRLKRNQYFFTKFSIIAQKPSLFRRILKLPTALWLYSYQDFKNESINSVKSIKQTVVFIVLQKHMPLNTTDMFK